MNAATIGTPCLVPVQVQVTGGDAARGFITRLSPETAAVSSDPALAVGAAVTLAFHSPVTGEAVVASGKVSEELNEGGLWRGRAAALVVLDEPLAAEVLGSQPDGRHPQRRGSEAGGTTATLPAGAALSGAFSAGLGRRRRSRGPAVISSPSHPDVSAAPDEVPVPPDASAPPESDAYPVPQYDSDEHTAPPRGAWLTEPEAEPAAAFFTADESMPPVRATDPELPKVTEVQAGAPPASDDSDDEFFGMFGQVDDVPEFMLPQGAADSAQLGVSPEMERYAEEALEKKGQTEEYIADDGYFDPARSGQIEVPATRPDLAAVAPSEADSAPMPDPGETDYDHMLATGEEGAIRTDDPPPVRNTMSIGGAGGLPPWEEARGPDESLIPRNARIASSLPVSFWARGRSNEAIAQNFSKEGLYLAYRDTPPVRGAIVRIEFPIEGEKDSVPIRFNAEVRWQSSDRPGTGLPEGFGVQILTFESPKDRRRYDELLAMILTLHQSQSERESEQGGDKKWSWGTGSPS